MTGFWWFVGILIVFVVLPLALVLDRENARRDRERMDALTKRNRELVDKPGWIKKPWQHDPQRPTNSASVRGKEQ